MAELALKIGDGGGFEDGDIVDAFNRRRIRAVHAQHICHVTKAGRTSQGLRLSGLALQMRNICCQYRFERVSKREVDRVEIQTGERQRFSSLEWVSEGWLNRQAIVLDNLQRRFNEQLGRYERLYCACPNDTGEYIDVEEYLRHQLQHPQHAIFGLRGREVWHGGRTDMSDERLDLVWQAIEAGSTHRESDYSLWPMGMEEAKQFLFITVDDFDDLTQQQMVRPEFDIEGSERRILRKRTYHVDWRQLPGITQRLAADIEDRSKAIDIRRIQQYLREAIIQQKLPPMNLEEPATQESVLV